MPQNWTKLDVAEAGAAVSLQAPQDSTWMNVVLQDFSRARPQPIERVNQEIEALLKRELPEYRTISLGKVTVDTRPAYRRVGSMPFQGRLFHIEHVYFLDQALVHLLAFTTPQEISPQLTPVFDAIASSYKVGRPTEPRVSPTAPATWGPPLPALADSQVYRDPQRRFSLTVPRDWSQGVADDGAAVQFTAPDGADNRAVVIVPVQSVRTSLDLTLGSDHESLVTEAERQMPDYTPISLDKVAVDDAPAYKHVFKGSVGGTAGQSMRVSFIRDGIMHTLTFATSPGSFPQWEPVFDGMVGLYTAGR